MAEARDAGRAAGLQTARFSINLAPLELGNPFCEAKSELKYFDAALVEVPTIATPTEPFRQAIRDGETVLLASQEFEWVDAMMRLLDDAALRARMGRAAYHDVLWRYGPERRLRVQLVSSMIDQTGIAARAVSGRSARRLRNARRPPSPCRRSRNIAACSHETI